MSDVMEKPKAALDLIDAEIERLQARQKQLHEGVVAQRRHLQLQQAALQVTHDEIKTNDTILKQLHCDREKLTRK